MQVNLVELFHRLAEIPAHPFYKQNSFEVWRIYELRILKLIFVQSDKQFEQWKESEKNEVTQLVNKLVFKVLNGFSLRFIFHSLSLFFFLHVILSICLYLIAWMVSMRKYDNRTNRNIENKKHRIHIICVTNILFIIAWGFLWNAHGYRYQSCFCSLRLIANIIKSKFWKQLEWQLLTLVENLIPIVFWNLMVKRKPPEHEGIQFSIPSLTSLMCILRRNLNPVWNETFILYVPIPSIDPF